VSLALSGTDAAHLAVAVGLTYGLGFERAIRGAPAGDRVFALIGAGSGGAGRDGSGTTRCRRRANRSGRATAGPPIPDGRAALAGLLARPGCWLSRAAGSAGLLARLGYWLGQAA
jgi:hypothetical protein